MDNKKTLNAVVVEAGKAPQIKEIGGSLEDLQALVGGYIEAVYPFDDPVGLICNEEGKCIGLPLNRALRDEDGDIYDIVAGTFAVVGLGEDDFTSLPDELAQKYEQMFHTPESFEQVGVRIIVVPYESVDKPVQMVSGDRRLDEKDISFGSEILQEDNRLEFYMDVVFDADRVFGTNVCTTANDDWVNVYANYDLEARRVCDTLDVYLTRGDGSEQAFQYILSDEEKALLLPKMEAHCQEQFGHGLDECCAQYSEEAAQALQCDMTSQTM